MLTTDPNRPQLVIISGCSGTGKTAALSILEDLDYYCIDNLPLSTIDEVCRTVFEDIKITKLALVVDARALMLDTVDARHIFERMSQNTLYDFELIYLTAKPEKLIARFASTRRKHPLSARYPSLSNALIAETDLIAPLMDYATMVIDTSELNIHELKSTLTFKLAHTAPLKVLVTSFGFKHGSPIDADYVVDVRMLPNPHWQPELRAQTGLDPEVIDFFEAHEQVIQMLDDLRDFFRRWLPSYVDANRHHVTIAIGCTGGQHRSVYLSKRLGEQIAQLDPERYAVTVQHRESGHWNN